MKTVTEMEQIRVDRRTLLKSLSAAAALSAAPAMARRRRHYPLGLQSFTAMKLLEADFDGTLAMIAALGYREIETLGSFGRDPATVQAAFARHGLVSPSQHLMPGDLYETFKAPPADRTELIRKFADAFSFDRVDAFIGEAIVRAKALKQSYIVWQVSWQSGQGLDKAKKMTAAFNRAGELCARAGLQFAFHNHDHEFEPIDGIVPYEYMVEHTDPKTVKLQIDFMWALKAGADPAAYFRKYSGRYRLCHLKDRTADGNITGTGHGIENFPALIKQAEAAGIEHYYFEYDRPVDPAAEIREAAAFLGPLLR